MRTNIALICAFVFIAVACQQTSYKKEIVTIDSLFVEIDTIEMMHRRIDTSDFSALGQKFSDNLSFVQSTYTNREDTMPKDVALLMSDYRSLKKPSKGLETNYQKVHQELKFTKSQLSDLKHDLQNNLLDSILVREMLEDERQAVKDLKSSVEDLKLSSEYTKKKRAEFEPRIDSLIQVLKQDES